MSPFEFLGVGADADERTVKRAYAAGLRLHRPDEDPEGFQALHEAYQAALHLCRHSDASHSPPGPRPVPHDVVDVTDATTSTAPVADAAVATVPAELERERRLAQPPPLDPRRLCDEVFAHGLSLAPAQFDQWLHEKAELLSLAAKEAAGHIIFAALFEQVPPMPADGLDVLVEFFNLGTVDARLDPLALASLRTRMHLRWELLARDHADYVARRERVRGFSREVPPFSKDIRYLLTPGRNRWMSWLAALLPGMVPRVARFLTSLDGGRSDRLPSELDGDAVRFWLSATERDFPTAGILQIIRVGVLGAAFLLGLHYDGWPQPVADFQGLFALGMLGCAVAIALIVWRQLRTWLTIPESSNERLRYVRLFALPVAAVSPPLFARLLSPGAGIAATAFFLTLAISRLRIRLGMSRLNVWSWNFSTLYGAAMLSAMLATLVAIVPYAGSGSIVLAWAFDAWKQRQPLREALQARSRLPASR